MSDKDETRRLLALFVDAVEYEQNGAEAETELVADGVNVTAFLSRIHGAVAEKKKEERLAWRKAADENLAQFGQTEDFFAMYSTMPRAQLIAEAQKHANELHFKNLEEVTTEDLRTQLADRARLEQLARKK